MLSITRTLFTGGFVLLPALLLGAIRSPVPGPDPGPMPPNRYVGAHACKNCHSSPAKGDQFAKWQESKHSKAYELLGTPQAKEVAAKLKIDDPQKSAQCLECHVTAYGLDAKEIKTGFKPEMGVQCETCHGPGEMHIKKRFAAAGEETDKHVQITPGEIITEPGPDTCQKCHNPKSPSFKPFCFKERRAEIEHLDPRKKRTPEELAARKCECGKDCKCKESECSKTGAKEASKKGEKQDGEGKK